jgi:Cof subfamily protein (haloacid dehalogenase superfamily)
MYSVIVTDLDGTLLDSRQELHPRTVDAFVALKKRGMHLVIATGRHLKEAAHVQDQLGVEMHFITSNGARIHGPDGECLWARDVEPKMVGLLTGAAADQGVFTSLYTDDAWISSALPEWIAAYDCGAGFVPQEGNITAFDGMNVAKVMFMGEVDNIASVAAHLIDTYGDSITVTHSLPQCLEVTAKDVCKGHALTWVLDRLGIESARSVVFGDGPNDVTMLEMAGHPCVMGNAHPDMLRALPRAVSIGHHNEAGVADQLERMFAL